MKYLLIWIFFISFNCFPFVVLIDPGHGGKEFGATTRVQKINSKGKTYNQDLYEKDLTLALAKKLKLKLKKHFSVYLTRSFDRTVSLEKRADMADTVKADIFISIHFNSSLSRSSHGIETYYLDNHNDKAIEKIENIENKGLEGESKVINQILIDLAIQKTVPRSKKLAGFIHGQITTKISKKMEVRDRGIKPGLFYVLALSKRPGVLIEGGFISNSKEASKISSNKYLSEYADAVAHGILQYYNQLPKKNVPLF